MYRISLNRAAPGGSILILYFVLLYWLPLIVWLITYSSVGLHRGSLSLVDSPFWPVLGTTVWVSLWSTVGSVVAAYIFVLLWLLSRRAREWIILLMVIPLILGFLARNYAWIGFLSHANENNWLIFTGLLYSRLGVYLVMGTLFIPTAFFVLLQGLTTVSSDMIDAARTLGANDNRILWHLICPLTYRAQLLALLLNFAVSLGYFVTPRMIGGGKLSFMTEMILTYFKTGDLRMASILATCFLAVVALPALLLCTVVITRREWQAVP